MGPSIRPSATRRVRSPRTHTRGIWILGLLLAAPLEGQSGNVLFPVEDVFEVRGTGTVVTGRMARGTLSVGDRVELVGPQGVRPSMVIRIDVQRQSRNSISTGDQAGIVLRGVLRGDVGRGYVVASPGSIGARMAVRVRVAPLSTAWAPDRADGRSGEVQVLVRTAEARARWVLPDDRPSVPTGTAFEVVLVFGEAWALEAGTELVFRQGGREVGRASVIDVLF